MKNSRLVVTLVAFAAVVPGCATRAPAPPASLYERLGGAPVIEALVDDGIANIAADPRIAQRFASTPIDRLRRSMIEFVCARTGGPCVYSGRNMADAHEGMNITDAEFDAIVDDLARSLDRRRVPAPERAEVLAALDRLRNAIVGH